MTGRPEVPRCLGQARPDSDPRRALGGVPGGAGGADGAISAVLMAGAPPVRVGGDSDGGGASILLHLCALNDCRGLRKEATELEQACLVV
jgi:hypothetical protein